MATQKRAHFRPAIGRIPAHPSGTFQPIKENRYMSSSARTIRVFVGTYTQTTSKGIYVYDVDTATGVMEYVSHVGRNHESVLPVPDAGRPLPVRGRRDGRSARRRLRLCRGRVRHAHAPEQPVLRGRRPLFHRRAPRREGRACGQLRRRVRVLLSRERRRLPGRGGIGHPAHGLERRPEPPAGTPRPHDPPRPGLQLRLLAGPGHRQGDDLRPRPGHGRADAPRRGVGAAPDPGPGTSSFIPIAGSPT